MAWRPDIREWLRRLLDAPVPRFSRRAPPRAGLPQNQPELALLERQAKAAESNVKATVALTGALLLVAFCQWQTNESTAAIERAKAIPRFRVDQTADANVDNGFLPKSLSVIATSGVSTATEATVRPIFLIHYHLT